jgi:hypothetical protein
MRSAKSKSLDQAITKYQPIVKVGIFFGLSMMILRGLASRWLTQNGDAAGFVDVLADPMRRGKLDFSYGMSAKYLYSLISAGPDQGSKWGFANPWAGSSFIHWHPYLVGYISSHFNFFLSAETYSLLFEATSISFGMLLVINLVYRASEGRKVLFIFLGVVLSAPIFFESIQGQPYFDKIFFGPIIAIIILLTQENEFNKNKTWILSGLILFCILLSERTSLMVTLIVFAIIAMRRKERLYRLTNIKIVLGLASFGIIWFFCWRYFIQNNDYYQGLTTQALFGNLKELIFGARRGKFLILLATILPFLIIQLRNLHYLLISISSILPNLIISVGGAELTGFDTHYLALCLPILIALSAISLASDQRKPELTSKKKKSLIYLMCLASILSFLNYNKVTNGAALSLNGSKKMFAKVLDNFGITPTGIRESREISYRPYLNLFNTLPLRNSASPISTPENMMTALLASGQSKFDYFPVGLGVDDYVIVPFVDQSRQEVAFSVYGLVPVMDRKKWSAVYIKLLNSKYTAIASTSGSQGPIVVYRLNGA